MNILLISHEALRFMFSQSKQSKNICQRQKEY